MFYYPVTMLGSRVPKVSSGFLGSRSDHYGADIMFKRLPGDPGSLPTSSPGHFMPSGRAAVAFADGVVTQSGWQPNGDRIRIDHGGGLSTVYRHLRNRRFGVGQKVRGGQRIGDVSHGKTHDNPGGYALNHLHFEVSKNGRLVDPAPYLRQAQVLSRPKGGLALPLVVGGVAASYLVWRRYYA